MRNMLISLAVVALAASSALAGSYEYDREMVTITATSTNAATAVVGTIDNIRGEIAEIQIDLATATTATVVVATSPELSTMTGETLYTGTAITADATLRPLFDGTDATGSALTNDDPVRTVMCGDSITITVSDFDAVSKVVKAIIKYKK
jgi:hypothetical protein